MSRRSSNYWVKLPESKRPNSKCYIKTSSDDSQVIKLHSYVAGIVEPFLQKLQTDKPVIPFLFFELTAIITCLLEIIVQLEVIESCKCARQPKEINLTDKAKLLPVEKINNCFSVDVVLNKLKRSNAITSQINELKKGTQLFVITMLSKLFERSPLGSAVLQCVFLTHQECQYFQEKSCMRNSKYF